TDRTADRAFDESGGFLAHLSRKLDLGLRPHRAHLDEQLAGDAAGEEARSADVHRLDRRGVGENRDHRLDFPGELGVRTRERIPWDAPIEMGDGLVLRADVFLPVPAGRYPVILSYGPYAKGLAFQDGYAGAWERMAQHHPDVTAGSSNRYQNWEVVDPEKWVPYDYAVARVDSRGCGCSPGYIDHFSPRETADFYACIEWAGVQPWSNGKVGL